MKLLLPLSTAWSSRAVKRMKDENAIQTPYIYILRIKGSRPPRSPAVLSLLIENVSADQPPAKPRRQFAWAEAFPIKASDYTAK